MANKKEPPFFNEDNIGTAYYKLPTYETMELFIETLTGTSFELRVSPFETVVCVKGKIQRLEGIPVSQQHLIWNNIELEDDYCLNDYDISEGCTLKLILAMRGGPINTRRVPLDDPIREMAEYMDPIRDDLWEKTASNKQVTFLVYREGDQLNFFRVVDRGDGTLTPLSDSLSGGSVYNMFADEEDEPEPSPSGQQIMDNSITMNKMKMLKSKMESMNLNKKQPKKIQKLKPRPPMATRLSSNSVTSAHHRILRVLPHIGQSCLAPGTPQPSESSHNALSSITAARTISSIGAEYLSEEDSWKNVSSPSLHSISLPPKISRVDLESARYSKTKVLPPVKPLTNKELLTTENSILHQNINLSSDETARSMADSFTLLNEVGAAEPYGELCSLGKVKTEFGLPDGNKESPTIESHHKTVSSAFSTEAMETAILNTRELSPPGSKRLSPLHYTSQVAHNSLPKQRQSKCIEIGSLRPATSQNLLRSLEVRNMADSSFSRTTTYRGVKVTSPGKRSDVISKMEARDMTEVANKASKEPVGSLNNLGFFTSLARCTNSSSNPGRFRASGVAIPSSLQEQDYMKMPYLKETKLSISPRGLESMNKVSDGKFQVESTCLFPPVTSTFRNKKKSSKHCHVCGRKTGLASSYECRCGNNFCATHRYAETHDCTYDYKAAGRQYLQQVNPIVAAPKLPKI